MPYKNIEDKRRFDRENKQKKLAAVRGYKSALGCARCNEREPVCLDFHHTKNDKEKEISALMSCSWARLWGEIEKCIVLCANCHRKEHRCDDSLTG